MIRRVLLVVSAMIMSLACWAVPNSVYIWMKDGSKTVFHLSEKPHLTFNAEEMTVATDKTTIILPYRQLKNITYKDEPDGLKGIANNQHTFKYDGKTLTFKAGAETLKAIVLKTDGVRVLQITVQPNESTTIAADKLPKGSYAVVVNGITYKIMKP